MGAAPACRTAVLALAAAALFGAVSLPASSAEARSTKQKAWPRTWAVAVASASQANIDAIPELGRAGINAVVVNPARWTQSGLTHLTRAAAANKMVVIAARTGLRSKADERALARACRSATAVLRSCAVRAATPKEAFALSAAGAVDYVVVQMSSPQKFRTLRPNRSRRTQIVAVARWLPGANDIHGWQAAIADAQRDPATAVTVAPDSTSPTVLARYLSLLARGKGTAATNNVTSTASRTSNRPKKDTVAPSKPSALAQTAGTATSIAIGWNASTDNVGVTGYAITADGANAPSTAASTTSIGGLACGTTQVVGVTAFDAAGNRSRASTITASTAPCGAAGSDGSRTRDRTAPTAPSGVRAAASTATSVSLGWTASTDNVGVSGYGVYAGGTLVTTTSGTTFAVTGLRCSTTYSFSIDAFDAAGNHSAKTPLTAPTSSCAADSHAPTAPSSLHATAATSNSLSVAWTASSDDVGVSGYTVFLGSSGAASTVSPEATLGGLVCGTSYTLGVEAFDAAGNRSTRTTLVTATASCPVTPDTQAPTAPTGVGSSSATATSITVTWTASSDNVGVNSYGVYQGGAVAGSSVTTSYTVSGLACGTTYSLSVDAADAAGNRSGKATATLQTSACAIGAAGTANIFISATGAGCHRYATPVSYAVAGAANACGPSSWGTACALAQSGDTILVEDGSYGSQNLSICTGHEGYSANAVFAVEPGHECPVYWPNVPAVGTDMSCPVSVSDLNLRTQYTNGGNCPGGGTGHFLPSTLGDFSQWINHLEFHDMYITGFTTRCVRDLVLSNVDGQNWFLRSAYHVRFLGGSYSNQFTGDCPQLGNFVGPDAPLTEDVLISRVIFHDQRHDNSPTTHPDGLFVQDSDTVTITGSIFVRDDVIPLYINGFGGKGIANLTITNNQIHTPTNHISGYPGGAASGGGGNSLNLGDYPLRNVEIAFNSIEGPIYRHGPGCNSNASPSNSNVAIYANITSGLYGDCDGNCKSTIAYAYNVAYAGATCDSSDVSAGAGYASADAMSEETTIGDHRLAAGAAATALVPATWCAGHAGVCPASDFAGTARPDAGHASALDAGAYENR